MRNILLRNTLLFIISGLLFATWSHYSEKGFSQPINYSDFLLDLVVFGAIVLGIRLIEQYFRKKKSPETSAKK